MPVTLESRLRQMQVFNLDHTTFCREKCACSEVAVIAVGENPRTGERAQRRVVKKVPASLTFLALERRSGLPSALLAVPSIKSAIQLGHVRVVEQVQDKPPTQPAAPAAPAKEAK